MLHWISPFRNALLFVALAACFVLSALGLILVDEPQIAASPSDRLAANARQTPAIDVLRLDRLVTATPIQPPTLKDILDSAAELALAGLMARPAKPLMSRVAPAAVTPTSAPAPADVPAVEQRPDPLAAPASPQAAARAQSDLPVAPPPEESGAVRQAAPGPGAWIDPAFTRDVWDAVNALRVRAALPPLREDGALASAASAYALDLAAARSFSHTGPDGSTMGDRLHAAGILNVAAGEVLAMGSGGWTPDAVARTWLDSPPHRAIILGAFTRAGVACAFSQEDGSVVVRCVMELAA